MNDEKDVILDSTRYIYDVNLKLEVVASNEKDAEEFTEKIISGTRSFGLVTIKNVKCLRILEEKH